MCLAGRFACVCALKSCTLSTTCKPPSPCLTIPPILSHTSCAPLLFCGVSCYALLCTHALSHAMSITTATNTNVLLLLTHTHTHTPTNTHTHTHTHTYAHGTHQFGDLSTFVGDVSRLKVQLKASTVIDWSLQIASGMDYLHSLGIVHQNLSSRNVFMFPHRSQEDQQEDQQDTLPSACLATVKVADFSPTLIPFRHASMHSDSVMLVSHA